MKEAKQILASYLRTSIEDFGKSHSLIEQSHSIVNQQKLIQMHIDSHDDLRQMKSVEYIDDGFTGTNMERPRFQELIRDVECGKVACVIVKDLSRLGRSYLEVGDYLEKIFPAHGVRVIAITDGYDSRELTGMTGGLEITFRNFIYDSYSKDLSVKVRSAMHTRMEKGKFVNHAPYGYAKSPADKHQLVPDPETAPVVREIFRSILGGMTTTQVARSLNDRHVPTPLQYKQHKLKSACQNRELLWSHTAVLNILRNYKYTGAMVNHTRESRHLRDNSQRRTLPDEWIVTEGTHEALVTKQEFEQANAMLRHPQKTASQTAGAVDAVFYCGHCGRKLQRTHGKDTYFSCETHKYRSDAPCAGLRWSRRELESILLPIYRVQLDLLGREATAPHPAHQSAAVSSFIKRMAQLERDMNSCDHQKMHLFEAYHDGHLDLAAYRSQKAALTRRREQLRAERAKLEAENRQALQEQERERERQEKLRSFLPDDELKDEQIVEQMYRAIDRVIVLDDRHINVRWKFDGLLSAQHLGKRAV